MMYVLHTVVNIVEKVKSNDNQHFIFFNMFSNSLIREVKSTKFLGQGQTFKNKIVIILITNSI